MKKITTLTLGIVLIFAFGLMVGTVDAFPGEGSVGQPDDHEGVVTRVVFNDDYPGAEGWYLIMPYRGDFGDGNYLVDGWVINVWTDRDGNAWVYIFVHETDSRYTGNNPIWNTWDWFLGAGGGSNWKENSGKFLSNR